MNGPSDGVKSLRPNVREIERKNTERRSRLKLIQVQIVNEIASEVADVTVKALSLLIEAAQAAVAFDGTLHDVSNGTGKHTATAPSGYQRLIVANKRTIAPTKPTQPTQ